MAYGFFIFALHWFVHSELLLFITIGFPAIAAAFYGVSTKQEFSRVAKQARVTKKNLEDISCAYTLKNREALLSKVNSENNWLNIRNLTLGTSKIMSNENGQWQTLIAEQELELPG